METSLAKQQAQQKIHKSFVPGIIQPSRFVMFVWDNNGINPETLSGIRMHCTNGIIIQLAAVSHRNIHWIVSNNPTPVPNVRERSFKANDNVIDPLISKKRECPDTINLELQPTSKSEGEQVLKNTDFLWVVLKHQAALRCNKHKIPNWTGFNRLISEQQMSWHQIAYLPAIDQSPTKLETVKELLLQSKLKAEKLELQETDIVFDLAIYAKAVEILMMPQHRELRKFIVLRMGAFHISCIFLPVIGKRFGDAGLRNIIIEANLLGNFISFYIFKEGYNSA